MLSGHLVWLSGSAIAAAAAAWIRYGFREESVPGRAGPAILFAIALFLIFAGLVLPPLRPSPSAPTPRVVILDISASMDLPGLPGGPTRLDSARSAVQRLAPDRIVGFGTLVVDAIEPTNMDSVIGAADRAGSRLAAALRVSRAAGADSVVVITDGELEDREESRREAERLGLQVRELRTAPSMVRTTVRDVSAPARVSAGDTISFAIEISTQASGRQTSTGDSVTVSIEGPAGTADTVRVERPSPGHSRIEKLQILAPEVRGESAWHRFGVSLNPGADLLGAEQERAVWVEITRGRAGVVLVSIDPAGEPRQLLPVLERASRRGARAYLRIRPGRWVRAGIVLEPMRQRELARKRHYRRDTRRRRLVCRAASSLESGRERSIRSRGGGTPSGRRSTFCPGCWSVYYSPASTRPPGGRVAGCGRIRFRTWTAGAGAGRGDLEMVDSNRFRSIGVSRLVRRNHGMAARGLPSCSSDPGRGSG
jgi:hypothetical protein